jgi:hypothetical protein
MFPTTTDTLIFRGGEVKALGGGKIAGWLIKFGSADETDLTQYKDFFTKSTDFGVHTTTPLYYYHGQDPDVGRVEIGQGTIAIKDVGVWLDGQLKAREGYEKYVAAINEMATKSKLGFSSGSAPHLIERVALKNGSHQVTKWPLGLDASLTPIPADPRAEAFAVKSLADLPPISFDSLKGLYLGDYAETSAALAALRDLGYAHQCRVSSFLMDDEMSAVEKAAKIHGCFDEYRDTTLKVINGLMAGVISEETTSALKALRAERVEGLVSGLTIREHSDAVVAAVKGLSSRFRKRAESRIAEGRSLSDTHRAAIKSTRDELEELLASGSVPATSPATKDARSLLAEFLQIEADVLCMNAGA